MSLTRDTRIELMGWSDGELSGEALERVSRLLTQSDEAREFLDAMRSCEVGEWVRDSMDAQLRQIPAITDSVMGRIGPAPAPVAFVPPRRGRQRVGRPTRVLAVATSVSAGLALAAAIALYLRFSSAGVAPVAQSDPLAVPGATSSSIDRPIGAVPSLGVEVNDIDSLAHEISVFEIPLYAAADNAAGAGASSGTSSVVIWIDEDRATP